MAEVMGWAFFVAFVGGMALASIVLSLFAIVLASTAIGGYRAVLKQLKETGK